MLAMASSAVAADYFVVHPMAGKTVAVAPEPEPEPVTKELSILAATYGGNNGVPTGNRTLYLAGLCDGLETCIVPSGSFYSASAGGDPAPGVPKDLVITYACGGVTQPVLYKGAEAGGSPTTLACP